MSATVALVKSFPDCDLCVPGRKNARYDCQLRGSQWAYLCVSHFVLEGVGLGRGIGQKLELTGGTS